MMRARASRFLFYAASLAAHVLESALIAIGLIAVAAWTIAGFHPTAVAAFAGRLADRYLAAPHPARLEFLSFAALAGALAFVAVAIARLPAQLRRIRCDADARFSATQTSTALATSDASMIGERAS